MKNICIYGAGGFSKEVYWLALNCGRKVEAFIDLNSNNKMYNNIHVYDQSYFDPDKHEIVVAVGNPLLRKKISEEILKEYQEDVFTNLISNKASLLDPNIKIGYGSIICDNCVLTCEIEIGNFAQLNLATTVGHESLIKDYFTSAPGVHISGKVNIGNNVYFGTNSSVIENIDICDEVTVGAAACVVKNITECGIYVGTPAKKIK